MFSVFDYSKMLHLNSGSEFVKINTAHSIAGELIFLDY